MHDLNKQAGLQAEGFPIIYLWHSGHSPCQYLKHIVCKNLQIPLHVIYQQGLQFGSLQGFGHWVSVKTKDKTTVISHLFIYSYLFIVSERVAERGEIERTFAFTGLFFYPSTPQIATMIRSGSVHSQESGGSSRSSM